MPSPTRIEYVDPRLAIVTRLMMDDLQRAILGADLNSHVLEKTREIVAYHSGKAKREGIDFPELAIMVFPKQGGIEIVNRDMDVQGIRITILNLTVKYPKISVAEIVDAVKQIWPNVRTLDLLAHKAPGAG